MTPELKRLGFVETAAVNSMSYVTGSTAYAKACGYYSSAKETNALKGSLTKIEGLINLYGAPVVSKVSEKYPEYMTTVDSKVDTAVTLLQNIWTNRVATSTPVTYAKSAVAMAPGKLEELKVAREEYLKKIEATLALLATRAVALPADLHNVLVSAIAQARIQLDNNHVFEKVKAAYDAVLKYPAVVAVIERTAPVAAKAVDLAAPYYVKAKDMAGPYVAKVGESVGPYVTAIKDKVFYAAPAAATAVPTAPDAAADAATDAN